VHNAFSGRIFHKECKSLSKAGYKVVYIVQHDKDGEFDNVMIRALPGPGGRFDRMTRIVLRAYLLAVREDAVVYHIQDPELIPLGILLKLHGKKVIYDVHEEYGGSMLYKTWLPSWLRFLTARGVDLAEWIGAGFFDLIITATPHIAGKFPPAKTITIQNYPILDRWNPSVDIPYKERRPVLAYAGAITELRGIREMLAAVKLLSCDLDVELQVAGVFEPLNLAEELMKTSPSNVHYWGWQSRQFVADMLASAKIGLVLFHPVPNHIKSQPNKFFEYMAAGLPVVVSDFPLWREMVNESGCGLLVDPLKPEAIAEAISWLLGHPDEAEAMGKRGQDAASNIYNWDREAEKLIEAYDIMCKRERPA